MQILYAVYFSLHCSSTAYQLVDIRNYIFIASYTSMLFLYIYTGEFANCPVQCKVQVQVQDNNLSCILMICSIFNIGKARQVHLYGTINTQGNLKCFTKPLKT